MTTELLSATDLERRLASLGERLAETGRALVAAIPDCPPGPIGFAKALKVDKATASRFLRSVGAGDGAKDGLSALQMTPGPEPLREIAKAAASRGVRADIVAAFRAAVDAFEETIHAEAGDRSALDAMLTAWLPDAREDFELKRKQAVFRNLSQLKGKVAETSIATAIIYPAADGEHLDVVWILGYLKLQRLRPGVVVNFASRRVSVPHGPGSAAIAPRRPRALSGEEVGDGVKGLLLPGCCSEPLPRVRAEAGGDVMHYLWEGDGGGSFGPKSSADVVFAEVNESELPRWVALEPKRKRYVYVDVPIPVEVLNFDLIIHSDVLGNAAGGAPGMILYDTTGRGVADVNDRARDMDRLEMQESIKPLGRGLRQVRLAEAPWYAGLMEEVFAKRGWDAGKVEAFRVRIDYPLHGSQIALTYDAQARPQ